MTLPDLSAALKASVGDVQRAKDIAATACAAIAPRGGDHCSFISVAHSVAPAVNRRSDALLGCVFSAKDNIDAQGFATTCGSRALAETPVATADSWIVKALKDTGAQCVGKNNMHEFALGATGVNRIYGNTVNPWDAGRNVGGSSGGSASAVALRQVHLALGTDSGGSVRMPAAFVGVAGFKPTPGALPMDGVAGEAWSMDTVGLFTASAADVRIIWSALFPKETAGPSAAPRFAYLNDESMGRVEPVVWDQYQASVKKLRDGGADLTPVSIAGFDDCPYICISVVYPEVASTHYELMRTCSDKYDQHIRALICLGELWSGRNYLDAQRLRSVLEARFAALMAPFDFVLTPTVPIQPPRNGEPAHVTGDAPTQSLYTLIRFTVLCNVIGYPAISVPSGLDKDGLPTGLQIIARPGDDLALLDTASHIEGLLGPTPPAPS